MRGKTITIGLDALDSDNTTDEGYLKVQMIFDFTEE